MSFRAIAGALLSLAVLAAASPSGAWSIARVQSAGGVEAWLVEDHSLPLVTLDFSFAGGAAGDPADKVGLATMVTALLDEGAGPLDSQAYQGRLEDLAASVSFRATLDYVTGSLRTTRKSRDEAFDLLRLALAEPHFDAEPVARIRGDLQAAIANHGENPNSIASRVWWRAAFAEHPYGRPVDGTDAGIAAVTVDDLKRFVAERFARDTLLVAVVGDVTPDELKTLLDKTFGSLPAHAVPPRAAAAAAHEDGAVLLVKKAVPQSVAIFGEKGLKRDDPDWYAGLIDDYILGGGGFSSRLMTELREKRGLAYGVGSYLVPLRDGGVILGTVATQNSRVAESLALIRKEWQRMHDEGPTEDELKSAKTYLTGSFATQFDSTGSIAGAVLQIQQDKLGIDFLDRRNAYIEGVTLADAKRVAQRLFDAPSLGFAVVGTPENLTPTREVTAEGG